MISAKNISKTFVRTGKNRKKEEFMAVDNISLEIEKGVIFGILGPNGAGKTTLLRMLGGIMQPSCGTIEIEGDLLSQNAYKVKSKIGYLSGNTRLYGKLTPRELLFMWGSLYEMEPEAIYKATEHIFESLDMKSFGDNRIERLSTGQTQRTSIARCLVHSPQIYIFDEPTLGLDILSSYGILEFMKEEKHKGKTVIYSTHYMEEAEELCDEIMLIHRGKIMTQGTKQDIRKNTQATNLRDAFIKIAVERGELE